MTPYFDVHRSLLANIVVLTTSYPWFAKDTAFTTTVERSEDQKWRGGNSNDVDRRWTTPDLTGGTCPGRFYDDGGGM